MVEEHNLGIPDQIFSPAMKSTEILILRARLAEMEFVKDLGPISFTQRKNKHLSRLKKLGWGTEW